MEAFEGFQGCSAQRQAEADTESPSQPENPGRAGDVLGPGCKAGREPGGLRSPTPAPWAGEPRPGSVERRRECVCSRGMVNTAKFTAMFLGLFPALVSLQHFYFRAFSLCIMCFSCLRERVRNLN